MQIMLMITAVALVVEAAMAWLMTMTILKVS